MKSNCLAVNQSKTNLMLCLGKTESECKITLYDFVDHSMCSQKCCLCPTIKSVDVVRYLGIMIDKNLNFKEHVRHLTKKVRWGVFILSRLRRVSDFKLRRILYFSFVQSYLQFGIIVWGGVYVEATLKPLIMLQKRAIRLVCGTNFYEHTAPLFVRAKILPFRKLFIYFMVRHAVKHEIRHSWPTTLSGRIQRYTYNFIPHSTRLLQSFNVQMAKIFNGLPCRLFQREKSIELKDFLMDKTYEEIESILTGYRY